MRPIAGRVRPSPWPTKLPIDETMALSSEFSFMSAGDNVSFSIAYREDSRVEERTFHDLAQMIEPLIARRRKRYREITISMEPLQIQGICMKIELTFDARLELLHVLLLPEPELALSCKNGILCQNQPQPNRRESDKERNGPILF